MPGHSGWAGYAQCELWPSGCQILNVIFTVAGAGDQQLIIGSGRYRAHVAGKGAARANPISTQLSYVCDYLFTRLLQRERDGMSFPRR